MARKLIFKDTSAQTELVLPVTPTFLAEYGVNVEIINIHELGDVALAGYPTAPELTLDVLFPAQDYAFCVTSPLDPYAYVERFKSWAKSGTVLRYIVSGTTLNIPVLIESIKYGEQDGTKDVYATVTMRKHKTLSVTAVETAAALGTSERDAETLETGIQSYTVVSGDTLSVICRQYYGDSTLCYKLASYNGIKNANLIYAGQVLQLPPAETLQTTAVTCAYTTETGKVSSNSPASVSNVWKSWSASTAGGG